VDIGLFCTHGTVTGSLVQYAGLDICRGVKCNLARFIRIILLQGYLYNKQV
jgi:hypothetical protein